MRLPPSHEFCCGLALLWIWLLGPSPLGAQAPEPYLIRNWQAEDGLPSNLLRPFAVCNRW
ncbi:MAG: hypothetical protein RLZZ399_2256 [Verrucomicrobiota bacterium]|jgi:hypothetical protein